MKVFERFIQCLCATGVIFAILYLIFPEMTNKVITSYGGIFGPIIVIGLFAAALLRKPKENK